MDLDRYADDPSGWSTSLANLAEVIVPALDAAGARSVTEVGAYAGDLTRLLADWATERGAKVVAVDPAPQDALVTLADERDELELVRATSLDALERIEPVDAIVLDGDHNWWTVTEELRLIERRAAGSLPLVLLHDVCWPHARRDDYFDAALIPDEYRHPVAGEGGGLFPGDPGLRPDGLPYPRSAAREGGPRNGVLTAVEDFVAEREDLRLVVVPAFFGLGVVIDRAAPWAGAVAEVMEPWGGNPVLARLEATRVRHIAAGQAQLAETWRLRERLQRRETVLARLLESSAFGVAERLSRLRVRAGVAPSQSAVSKDEIRRALD